MAISRAETNTHETFRATPVLLVATALVYRTDEIIQALES